MSSACSLTAQNRICCSKPFRPIVNLCPRWNRYSSRLQPEFTTYLVGLEYVSHNNTPCSNETRTATSDDSHSPSNLFNKNIGSWVIGTWKEVIVDCGNLRQWSGTNLIVYSPLTLCTFHYQMKHIVRSRDYKVTVWFLSVHVHILRWNVPTATTFHRIDTQRKRSTSILQTKRAYDTKMK